MQERLSGFNKGLSVTNHNVQMINDLDSELLVNIIVLLHTPIIK